MALFLIEIANRITSVFNENYTVSRMDGDEFGILIKSINKTKELKKPLMPIINNTFSILPSFKRSR